jgi:L-ascorbate metabolism protein UlaG (beta-lactamase superfamily)
MKRRLAIVAGVTAALAAIAVVLERRLIAAPRYRGPVTDHFDGKRFHNHQSGWQSEGSFLKWQLTKTPTPWPEWIESEPGPAPPRRVEKGALRVTIVNHATTLIQLDGINILTDPIWSERCSPVDFAGPKRHRAPGIRFDDLPPIDVVLLSHNHYDHLDVPTLRMLQRHHNPLIVCHLGNGALLARYGLTNVRELDWWGSADAPIRITSVPAQHFSARGLSDRDATLWGGYVIASDAGNVYFAGDTGWGKHFAEVRDRFTPVRLALLPIGAYLPRWFMKPAHITPAEAVDAHGELKAGTSVAMHYGTFALGDDGDRQPIEDLERAIAKKRAGGFKVLEFGQGFEVP